MVVISSALRKKLVLGSSSPPRALRPPSLALMSDPAFPGIKEENTPSASEVEYELRLDPIYLQNQPQPIEMRPP